MPWIHFHAGNNGYVKACCVANINYGNINNQSLEKIWNGEPINNLREKFKKGIPDNRCSVCINREKAGAKSIRLETHEKFPNININQIQAPIYFDIRFSNVCNFKCRTCWHGASSKWFDDAKKLGRNVSDKAIINNINDFNDFIEKTGEALLKAKEIYFAGGEPLVTEEHYLLLEYLLKHNATNIHLRYNTNFSKLIFKKWNIIELWSRFKHVEIMASVDDSHINGQMIRDGFSWELFLKNREGIKKLKNIVFKVSPTISVYNIKQLPAFYLLLLELDIITPENFYINILERPYHFNIKILSEEKKRKIKENYHVFIQSTIDLPQAIINSFMDIVSFMNEENLHQKYWTKFKKEDNLISEFQTKRNY